jgi:arsenite-transporting ATPase
VESHVAANSGTGAQSPSRISFFVGKGGVGKSTLACATAVRAALAGERVLLVSTDQAHSLGEVLGVRVLPTGSRQPTRIFAEEPTSGGGHLDALAMDTLALLETRWRHIAPLIATRHPNSDLKDLAAEELSALPGVQEVLGLQEVAELAESGRWDYLVVDCASTADAMRMLTLPATFAMYLERAWPRHRRLSSALQDPRTAGMVALVEGINSGVDRLSALLTDAERVSAHLVLTAERVVAAEARRTLSALALMGVQVAEVIVNQVLIQDESYEYTNLPAHPAFDWYAERISDQQSVLDQMSQTIGDVQLVIAPHLPGEPIGPKALGQLLDSVRRRDGAAPPGPLKPIVDRESGSGLDAIYRMRIELPLVDSGALALGRVGDDLVISVGGMRRRVRLASVLRRCIVLDAALCGTELTVRFRPNPEVWPA